MARKYHDGLVHGHCRYGECSCIFTGVWVDRYTREEGCRDAPWFTCPCCNGEGSHWDDLPCSSCAGVGELPGPHWPWRHPEPDLPSVKACDTVNAELNSSHPFARVNVEIHEQGHVNVARACGCHPSVEYKQDKRTREWSATCYVSGGPTLEPWQYAAIALAGELKVGHDHGCGTDKAIWAEQIGKYPASEQAHYSQMARNFAKQHL